MYCGVTWFDKFLEFYTKRLFLTPEGIVAVAPIIKFYFVTILKVIQMHTRIIYNIQSFIEGSHYNNGNVSSLWRIKKCISRNKLFCLIFLRQVHSVSRLFASLQRVIEKCPSKSLRYATTLGPSASPSIR